MNYDYEKEYYVTYFDEVGTGYGEGDYCYYTLEEAKDSAKHYKHKSKEVTFVRASVIDRFGTVLWYTY